jgi:thiol-disulfide isomerase/thioredoxin
MIRNILAWSFLFILVCGLYGCAEDEPSPEGPPVPAPEFTLPVLGEAGEISLAELRGKIVIVDFWATWCVPCEFQVPELNSFWDAHREDADLRLYGISVDIEGPDVVSRWVGEKGVRYPILLASDDLARKFGATGFPTLYVIGPDGSIDSSHVGLIESDILEKAVSRLRSH